MSWALVAEGMVLKYGDTEQAQPPLAEMGAPQAGLCAAVNAFSMVTRGLRERDE